MLVPKPSVICYNILEKLHVKNPKTTRYIPRNEITVKNIVDEFQHEGEVKMLIIFHDTEQVKICYRDTNQALNPKEVLQRLAVFSPKGRIF